MPDSRRTETPNSTSFEIRVDAHDVTAFEGDTVATVLLIEGVTQFHRGVDDAPRMLFCNMGTCFECTVTIDDQQLRRACLTPVHPGMRVTTGGPR